MRIAAALLVPVVRGREEGLGCTALAVDGGASIDGAAYAVENTDCNNCDFRLTYVAPKSHAKDATRAIFSNNPTYPRWVGYGRSDIYHPVDGQVPSTPWAHIPEVQKTYGYWESISPLMNDQGLGMGESSCGAVLNNKAPGSTEERDAPTGILDAMTIMQLIMERCATARCAVDTMGEIVEAYGYLPFVGEPAAATVNQGAPPVRRLVWGDAGEAYTIADKSGEAWVFNVMGGVSNVTKSVWAAQRVPKGHVAVVANEFTMGELPTAPTEDIRFNSKIREAARVAGLWKGSDADPLHFTRVFAPDPLMYAEGSGDEWNPPIPLYTSLRRWGLFNLVAPSQKIKFDLDHRHYPFSVPAEKPVSHREVMELMKYYYQGTEFDMSKGVLAGPFETPYRIEGGPKKLAGPPRGVTLLRTLYSTITQTGPNGSTLWYAPDSPLTSVYFPIDKASAGGVAQTFRTGDHKVFDRTAGWWAFDFVNNWMQLNFKGMSTEDVWPRVEAWQDKIDEHWATAQTSADVAAWQIRLQEEVVADWWTLADFLIMKWNDMSRTEGKVINKQVGLPEWWTRLIGWNQDIHPVYVQAAARPAPGVNVPGYVEPTVALPKQWLWQGAPGDGYWFDWTTPGALPELAAHPRDSSVSAQVLILTVAICVAGAAGFAAGRKAQPKMPDILLG